MSTPLPLRTVARGAWHDYRRARAPVVVFEVLFKLAAAVLLAPAVAALLAVVLAGAGRVAVTNRDLLDFLLTPAGVLYAALLGTVTVALLLLEQAGLMLVAGPARPPLRAVPRGAWRVARLGFGKLVLLALALAPFVLLAGLTYAALLTRHDLYFYWKDRPPVFWVAAGIGAVTLAAAVAAGLALCVRWAFALPILLFEGGPPGAALRASRERVRGVGWRVGAVLVGWQLAVFLAGAAAAAGFRLAAAAVLDGAGERPTGRVVLLLAAQGGLLAVVSFVAVVGHAVLTLRLYLHRNEQLGIPPPPGPAADGPASPWPRRAAWLLFAVAPVAPVLVGLDLARRLEDPRPVAVTAHRGHARAAPENTLSAIRKAIESGADYAEIDVQLTADGVPVLLHDRDLMRVAGDPRRLADLTLAEVRTLDVGRWFGPAFAGERVPTLAEVVDLARGRIRLNVELKSPGPDPRLARAVADLVRDLGVEADTLLTSFHPADLAEVRGHNPRVRTGLIVAHAVGDVSRLDVDVLNVRADHLTDELIGEAHRRGREVHVWTVNDPREMARFIKRGADNILTSDPDALVRVRDEWAGVTGPERLVLASRVLFGLEP